MRVRQCMNEAKGKLNGKALCGTHLASAKRRVEKAEAADRELERGEQMQKTVRKLAEQTGLDIQANYLVYPQSRYDTVNVLINLDDLKSLIT